MPSDRPDLSQYEATLRRQEIHWQAGFDFVVHCGRAAVDIGLIALKTAILINAGALVALLAFLGQLWDKDHGHALVSHALAASVPFVWGLVAGGAALMVAYFYQSAVTRGAQHSLDAVSEQNGAPAPSTVGVRRFTASSAIVMVLLAFASLASFVWGAFAVIHVFKTFVQ
jgi:hypothetical protein